MVVAVIGSVLAVLAQAANPLVQAHIIDHSIDGHRPILPLLLVMGGLFALRFAAGWVRRFFGGRISWEVDCDLRNAVYTHLQSSTSPATTSCRPVSSPHGPTRT